MPVIAFSSGPDRLNLVGAPIVVDEADYPGIHIAARNLAEDFARVTKKAASPVQVFSASSEPQGGASETLIIIGTLKRSPLIRRLSEEGKLEVSVINGKWESFTTTIVDAPLPGCQRALVIVGSDKRGAIFGTYSLAEEIGVSPWYYWADVPAKHHPDIYALPGTTTQGEPSVRFRGLFINDEAPALTGWVREKFGKYGVEFYKKVFELLLRLKANFLWPAMWPGYPNPGASFFTDDPDTQMTADLYGIVVSTSHHEPMQRLSNEWFANNPDGSWDWLTNRENITQFFREGVERAKGCESYFTMGMRGEYDKGMKTKDPAAVVRDVIKTQRQLIKEVHGREDAVPQLLALYKEVQDQYESGKLELPDDITLLFADDNFGSIRRLPSGEEAKRKGGAGIYYHFEYVGTPRSYKWINSNSLGKTWHQLREAHRRNARQIWVFNVGDIKPLEVPLSFAMKLAWDINSIESDGFPSFFESLAVQQFGPQLSLEVAATWHEYNRLASLRRHEHIEPQTFSILNYNEADTVLARWRTLLERAESIHERSSDTDRPAIFQLVLHPIKASYLFTALQFTLGRNQLYARQRRNTANKLAREVLELFDADYTLSEEFHSLLGGKWNHMLSQPHYGFGDTWHAPSRDMISGLCYVQQRQNSNPIVGQMGIAVEGHEGIRPGRTNEESDRTHPSRRDLVPGLTLGQMTQYGPHKRWFDIFTRGAIVIHWKTEVPFDWIHLSTSSGVLVPGEDDARVEISIDWDRVPEQFGQSVSIVILSDEGDYEHVSVPIIKRPAVADLENVHVEAGGIISIAAASCSPQLPYIALPEVGSHGIGSVTTITPPSDMPFLSYQIYTFTSSSAPRLLLYFNMTLDIDPADPMTYDVQIDGGSITNYRLVPEPKTKGELPDGWYFAVQDCFWRREHELEKDTLAPGKHEVRITLRHTNIILEKLVLDLGGLKDSYLGPPPT
ncbi:hypothetical protein GQ53DRAFT_711240 [Thozetella sp. PMI_491]|nr:hypothetical protein GQ53DRAFT_711240 [Thozetella sp. PMI_491]